MTHIASAGSEQTTRSHLLVIGRGLLWLLALGITVFFTAVVTSHYTREDNFYLAQKTQQLSQIDRFAASGQQVDVSLRQFDDALSDNKNIYPAREQLRAAIAAHAADAFAYAGVLGKARAKIYLSNLATFRDMADEATSALNGVPMAEFGLRVSLERKKLIDSARTNLASETKPRSWFWRQFE
jgi:hypothetical protein